MSAAALSPLLKAWARAQRDLGTEIVFFDEPLVLPEAVAAPAPAARPPMERSSSERPAPRPMARPSEAPARPAPMARPAMASRPAAAPPPPPAPIRPAPVRPAAVPTFATRAELGAHASQCTRCILGKDRERTVWSGSVETSSWMVLTLFGWGEDVKTGELLAGQYAQTFRDLARSVGLPEPAVGAVFCCPPRNPADTTVQGRIEATRCRPYWTQLLKQSGAKAVLVLDHKAAQLAVGKALEWPAFRGQPFVLEGIPAIATHHPARLARMAALAPEVEADLRQILSCPGVAA